MNYLTKMVAKTNNVDKEAMTKDLIECRHNSKMGLNYQSINP